MNTLGEFDHSGELFQSALREFTQAGYEGASLNTILSRAGMSKGQFYYHFSGKEELYCALIGVLIKRKKSHLEQVFHREPVSADIFTLLKIQARAGIAFSRENPEIGQFAESFMREKGRPIYHRVLERFNFEGDEDIRLMIERAYSRGEIRQDIPLKYIRTIITYFFTHAGDIADLAGPDDYAAGIDVLITTLQEGLADSPGNNRRNL
jgi:AcrR family transcriptional regulator